ncbi:Cobalt transporter [Azospirillaceae bacterium]
MAGGCCSGCDSSSKPQVDRTYRRILWIALCINVTMFLFEIFAGTLVGSVSLQADAMDFLGDAANYAVSLMVLGMALRWRARAAVLKGVSLGVLGLWVAGQTAWNALCQTVPQAEVMGIVGGLALLANVGCAVLLYTHRDGDANRQSVWICSRNDAIANIAVLIAALGVFGTGSGLPDILVAAIMAVLSVSGAVKIVRQAFIELQPAPMHVGAD